MKRNRSKDGIEAFEHAMQGVHTSRDHRIVSYTRQHGLIGSASGVTPDALDDTPSEREVIVKIRQVPRRQPRTPRQ